MRRVLFVTIISAATFCQLGADEGMFPISEIAALDLAEKGLKLSPSDIYSANRTSLIDGICKVNGCTGSFVSPHGLIITNHHCAYRAIQSVSSASSDYLKDGFSAATLADEVHAKGYTVRITESYEDISDQVLDAIDDKMTFAERTKAIERRQKELEKQAESDSPGMRAEVAEMFQGKTYVLFLYTYIKDVRLVFAPPAAVGNFGGAIDNWEWPRHTGDFSFMRAYVAPDGATAEYSEDNVPYQPKRFIQVAADGVRENDFVFLLGYPGRTARHKTSHFLELQQNIRLPFIVELYNWQIATMDSAGKDDRAVALKHTSRSQSLANTEKRSRGQLQGLKRADIIAARQAEEDKLRAFIAADQQRQQKYGDVLDRIANVYSEMAEQSAYEQNLMHLRNACRVLAIAFTLYDAAAERQKEDLEREPQYMDRNFDQTTKRLMLAVRDFHAPTDSLMLREMLDRVATVPDADARIPAELARLGESVQACDQAYRATRLGEESFVLECLAQSPDQLKQHGDPFLAAIAELYPTYLELRERGKEREGELDQLYGDLLEVKQQFLSADFVPDANATLRLTYGYVRGYSPEDAVIKTPITTLKGVIDKTTGVDPFVTPQKIIDMHAAKDFGDFAHPELGDVPVGILYSTDTTGGNSGSPVINARGELVGVNFDRAFEATINDFAWNESYSRSIGVDIRYALWISGQVFGATRLLEEMNVKR